MIVIWTKMLVFDGETYWAGWGHLWADWSVHITYVLNMTHRQLLLPFHPLWIGEPFRYHFVADLISAVLLRAGVSFVHALILPSIVCSFVLVTSVYIFFRTIFKNYKTAMVSTALFLCNGGLGFLWYIFYILTNNPIIYRNGPIFTFSQIDSAKIEFANVLTNYFIPQRPYLLGFPISICIILYCYQITGVSVPNKMRKLFFLGTLTGFFPVIHLYAYFVILGVCGFLMVWTITSRKSKISNWILFFFPALTIGLPLIINYWGTEGTNHIRFEPFWPTNGNIQLWFYYWTINEGLLFILTPISWYFATRREKILSIPFAALFIVSNIFLFQPYTWDNGKFITYSYLWSAGLVGNFLVQTYDKHKNWIIRKALLILVFYFAIFSGAIDLINLTQFERQKFRFFSLSDMKFGEKIREIVKKDDVLLTGHTSSLVSILTGRQLFMGLDFWVSSYGINTADRIMIIRNIYSGSTTANGLLDTYNIHFLVLSPREREILDVNDEFISKHFTPVLKKDNTIIYKRIITQ